MITGTLRNDIDKLWTEFWTGGIANPLTVIEQITFLMFARLLDIQEERNERIARKTGKQPARWLFDDEEQNLRWSQFKNMAAGEMLPHVRDKVFPHFRKVTAEGSVFGAYMKDAQLLIQRESLLVSAVNMIDDLPLTDADTKGDLYEYLLSKLTTAGINGQFRTPRHIIKLMVELVDPQPTETVADPACGTGGFLAAVALYLLEQHSSEHGVITDADGNKTYTGDLLVEHQDHIQNRMFHGFDFDATMLRIASMNLVLHGVDAPDIHYADTLSVAFPERFPNSVQDAFDVILANPPFKGSIAEDEVLPGLTARVKTKKTELLFIVLILRMLKVGGRSATIVPDGVLFGTSKAHQDLRKMLIENNQLEAVIKLPSGVFKPYAGVATAILVYTKGGATKDVFFYDVQADGFSLDDNRRAIDENDLPDVMARWRAKDPANDTDRKDRAFFVPAAELKANKFDLSLSRYKETEYEEEEYDPPKDILARMKALHAEIADDLDALEEMLGQ